MYEVKVCMFKFIISLPSFYCVVCVFSSFAMTVIH